MKKKIMIGLLVTILTVAIMGCGNNNTELQPQADQEAMVQEDILMEKISEEPESEGNEEQTEEIVLSEQEKNDLTNLIDLLTFSSYFFGGEMEGYSYPVNDIEMNIRMIGMVGSFSLADDTYAKYLPPMEIDYENLTGYCNSEDMQDYLKNVFGVENVDLSAYSEGGKVVCSLLGDLILDDTQIDHVTVMQNGTYEIVGTAVVIEAGVYESAFPYQFTARKNDSSPYGYQVVSIAYEEGRVTDNSFEEQISADGVLSEILLNPEENSTYYPQGVEYQHILFALLDIDQDGEDEVLLGSASDISPYWGANWITIFNILRYDRNTGKVSDFDGDKIYSPLDANSWHYYDTGILMTMVEAGQGHTNFWNLLTGEFVDAALQVSEDPNGGPDSEGHSKIYNMDGRDITGEEADQYYQFLKSGNEIPIIWCEVSQDNVDALVTGGNVRPVYIPTPYGRYRANREFELEFFDDNTVLVSEGNSNKKCAFTIDGAGNLIIDPDGEAVEGTYDAQADEIKIYELRFRR